MRLAFATLLVVVVVTAAHAGTKRVAVVVGNNIGNADQVPLHHAESVYAIQDHASN
jgi:hypothetical protein